MDWSDLRYFLAVARGERLNIAARALGVDQATVGRRLTRLEESFGAPLFERGPKGYALTDAGLRLMPAAEQMERAALAAADAADAQVEALTGAVRIGAPVGAATYLLAEGAVALSRRHPGLELQVVALPLRHSLSKREADMAITVTPPQDGRLLRRKLADYKLRIYATRQYLDSIAPIETPADLTRAAWIAYIPDLIMDRELDILPLINPDIQPRLTSANIHVQLRFVLAHGGLCVMHDFIAREHPELVCLFPEELSFTRSYWLVTHADYRRSRRVREVAEWVATHLPREIAGPAAR